MEAQDEIVDNFFSEEEENIIIEDPLEISKEDFKNEVIINIMQSKGLLKTHIICPKCNKVMKLVNSKANVDKVIWRCRSSNPSHDIKINIRAGSIFENINVPLNAIYFLAFNCFIKNYSTRKASNEMKRFSELMDQTRPNLNTIIKIFRLLRTAIKKYYHDYWNHNLLGSNLLKEGLQGSKSMKAKS